MQALPPPSHARRLLLALASAGTDGGLRAILDALMHASALEMSVLYVEDADLLGVAALPFTREVGLVTGIARDIGTASVERTMRVQASRAEEHARRLATELRVRWSFEVSRGRLGEEVARRAPAADLVLVAAQRPPATVRPPASRRPLELAVWLDAAGASALRTLDTALAIARARACRMTVLHPAGLTPPSGAFDAWVRNHVAGLAAPLRVLPVAGPDWSQPGTAIPLHGQDVLVAPVETLSGPPHRPPLTMPRCTLVLVR
ncbi:MAG: hypothetical protein GC151_08305 [Betaproteobacteria bacterium]|nr:hypothetical protein [Betaproteobacteria bacterium]